MDVDFCVAAIEETLARYGRLEIFNTDQESQFTSFAFTTILKELASTSRWTGVVAPLSNGYSEARLALTRGASR